MILKIILLIALGEVLICAAQFLFKYGANDLKMHNLSTFKEYVAFMRSAIKIPAIWGGLLMNTFAIVIWIIILALLDLSLAVPLDSIHYIAILLGSHFFLKERLTWERIAGTLLITGGIVLVALG